MNFLPPPPPGAPPPPPTYVHQLQEPLVCLLQSSWNFLNLLSWIFVWPCREVEIAQINGQQMNVNDDEKRSFIWVYVSLNQKQCVGWGCRDLSSPSAWQYLCSFDRLICWLWDSPALSRELLTTCSTNNEASSRSSWAPIMCHISAWTGLFTGIPGVRGRRGRESSPSLPSLKDK